MAIKRDDDDLSNNRSDNLAVSEDPEAQEIAKLSLRERVSNVFTHIHSSARELTLTYQAETRKIVYVTPVIFMSLFETFETLLSRKNFEIEQERSKYDQGVRKLDEAKKMIEEMEVYLEDLRPKLEKKTAQVEKTVKRLVHEEKEVMAVKAVVDEETAEARARASPQAMHQLDSLQAVAALHLPPRDVHQTVHQLRPVRVETFTKIFSSRNE